MASSRMLVGGGVGALVGAGVGYAVDRWLVPGSASPPPEPEPGQPSIGSTPTPDPPGKAAPPASPGQPGPGPDRADPAPKQAKPAPHEVFGVPTFYLTTSNDLFVPLTQFEMMLQFKEERDAFSTAVAAIDDILGFETLLLTKNPLSNIQLPKLAQMARNRVQTLLKNIIAFSNEQRPSPTKKKSMEGFADTVVENLDGVITHMHRQHAATTVYDEATH